ncbi:MAG: TIGR03016 family PEP-CTERM system-associated outer membrane protein [Methylococcales bacterium]
MVMGSMVISSRFKKIVLFLVRIHLVFFIYEHALYAKNWLILPSFTSSEIYTDNYLLSNQKKGAFISEFSPGLSITNKTNRLNVNLNYKLQDLYNESQDKFNMYHKLQFNSTYKASNFFNIDSRASSNQVNINSNAISSDNITGAGNIAKTNSYGVSPYWTPNFNGYALGNFRVNYDAVNTSDTTVMSNMTKTDEIVSLSSGSRFSTGTWNVNYNNSDEIRNVGGNVKYQNASLNLQEIINRKVKLFSSVGYANNVFETVTDSSKNGVYYTVGGIWAPSWRTSLEMGYGNNSHVTLNVMPIRNLQMATTFRNNKIGTNTGNVWQARVNYQAQRSIVNVNYAEDTTTTQAAILNLPVFNTVNAFNEAVYDPTANSTAIDFAGLSNEVYVRKRADSSYNFRTSKSFFSFKAYNERRIYQLSNNNQFVIGMSSAWNWMFSLNKSIYITPNWQETTSFNPNTIKQIRFGFSERLPLHTIRNGSINLLMEYGYTNQNSNSINSNYDENRLTASAMFLF